MPVPTHSTHFLSSFGVADGTSPRTPESSNDEALDYCINNATNSAVSRQSPSRVTHSDPSPPPLSLSLSLSPPLSLSRSIQLARIGIDIISLLHPSGLAHECVYTAFGVAADTRFPLGR